TLTTLPELPTPLSAVSAITAPGAAGERVVTLDTQGRQTQADPADPAVDDHLIARLDAKGEPGELHVLPDGRWVLGVGDPPEDGAASAGYLAGLRKAGATLTGKLRARREDGGQPDQPGQLVALSVAELSESGRTALVTGLVLGSHRFRVSHRQPPPPG